MKTYFLAAFLCCTLIACGGGGGSEPTAAVIAPIQPELLAEVPNMPAGFQVIGDHGGIQIDENFYNMSLAVKGTLSFQMTDDTPKTITYTGTDPIICFRTDPNVQIALISVTKVGSVYTYKYATHVDGVLDSNFHNVVYYIFDHMPATASRAGLTIYDAAGNITFSSDQKPMIIAAMAKSPDGAPGAGDLYTLDSPTGTGVYATCLSSAKYTYTGWLGGTTIKAVQAVYSTPTGGGTKIILSGIGAASLMGKTNPYGGSLLVVNVAGL